MVVINTTAKSKAKIQSVLEEGGGVAVLDFMKKDDKKCSQLDPFAEQLNSEHNVPLIKIDADQSPDLAKDYLVDTVPTFVVIKETTNNILHIMNCNNKEDVRKIFDTAIYSMGINK